MNNKGFTMVELLSVFVLLGILSMITIPAVTKYIDKARQNDYDALATSAYNAATNYIMSNNGDYTGNVTLKKLEDYDLINNIKDPVDNSKDCTGYVTITEDDSVNENTLSNYKYSVNLCCSLYKYKYTFNDISKSSKDFDKVKISDSDGKNCVSNDSSVTVSGNTATLPVPSISDWNYVGWSNDSSNKKNCTKTVSVGENKTYDYYLWVSKTFNASYTYKDGNDNHDITKLSTNNKDSTSTCTMWNSESSCTVTLPNLSSTLDLGRNFGEFTEDKCSLKGKKINMRELFDYSWSGDYLEKVNEYQFKINKNTSFKLSLNAKSSYINKKLYVCANSLNLWLLESPYSDLKEKCTKSNCEKVNNMIAYILQNEGGYFKWDGTWSIDFSKNKFIMFYGKGYNSRVCKNHNHTGSNCDPGGIKYSNYSGPITGWVTSSALYK